MRNEYPEAADIIQNNTYMESIESKDNHAMARKLSLDIEKAIVKGGFQFKKWIISGDISKQEETVDGRERGSLMADAFASAPIFNL